MNAQERHLENIRSHSEKMRQLADIYADLATMAEREGSQLAPLLDLAGAVVAEHISNAGQLLSQFLKSTKEELNTTSRPNDGGRT